MSDAPVTSAALRERRETTIARLCEHFARDHIEAEELEQLIDRAHRAVTLADLDALTAGLPALDAPMARAAAEPAAVARAGFAPGEHQLVVAVMGGAVRRGNWTPARNLYVGSFRGGSCLDFREAHFSPGVTDVTCFVMMGGVEVIVPPGVHVDMNGFALMGSFGHRGTADTPPPPDAPVLRIGGVALMGAVDLQVRLPGETERDVRARERLARRDARRLNR